MSRPSGRLPPSTDSRSATRTFCSPQRALEVIQTARPLLPGSYLGSRPRRAWLCVRTSGRGRGPRAKRWPQSLVRLVRSDRPDWGSALLVGLARLAALDQTRQIGILGLPRRVCGRFAPPGAGSAGQAPRARPPCCAKAARDFERARARLLRRHRIDPGFHELDFAELEASGNRLVEALRAGHDGEDLRLWRGRQPPARSAALTRSGGSGATAGGPERATRGGLDAGDRLRGPSAAPLRLSARHAQLRDRDLSRDRPRLRSGAGRHYSFWAAAITRAEPGTDAAVRDESIRRLGGHVEMTGLRFIPRCLRGRGGVDLHRVRADRDPVATAGPAWPACYRDESSLRVFLRESNTLTSTLYDRQPSRFVLSVLHRRHDRGPPAVRGGQRAHRPGRHSWPAWPRCPSTAGQTLWAGPQGRRLQPARAGLLQHSQGIVRLRRGRSEATIAPMRVLLVHPSPLMYSEIYLRLEPLGLERVAAAVRAAGHDVRLLDLQIFDHDDYYRELTSWEPEAVGLLAELPGQRARGHRPRRRDQAPAADVPSCSPAVTAPRSSPRRSSSTRGAPSAALVRGRGRGHHPAAPRRLPRRRPREAARVWLRRDGAGPNPTLLDRPRPVPARPRPHPPAAQVLHRCPRSLRVGGVHPGLPVGLLVLQRVDLLRTQLPQVLAGGGGRGRGADSRAQRVPGGRRGLHPVRARLRHRP